MARGRYPCIGSTIAFKRCEFERQCVDLRAGLGFSPVPATSQRDILKQASHQSKTAQRQPANSSPKPLIVMKFGGTSVGDASCIERVIEIVHTASRENHVVVVVSAMSGVTNRLLEAAEHAQNGNRAAVAAILEELCSQHLAAAGGLIHSAWQRDRIEEMIQDIFHEGDHFCQDAIHLRRLTLQARDSISGLGERLSAPLVASAIAERGLAAEPIYATDLVVTNSYHGAADPRMDLTRLRCQARLNPLLHQTIVPVITGFIGATTEGVLTTLGRGGSDYSATILGSALDADEVIIWTDVNGVLTADPRLVSDSSTIRELSYREATELAYFGAKVLHPKTLRPVMQSNIPVWIRNTFAPDRQGTKITPAGSRKEGEVKALAAISDVALITVSGPSIVGTRDVQSRIFKTASAVRAEIMLISQSPSQADVCFVVPYVVHKCTVEALRQEFAQDLADGNVEHIRFDTTIAIVAVVGEGMRSTPGIIGRTRGALDRENINIMALAQGASGCGITVVVAQEDIRRALATVHQEFRLDLVNPGGLSTGGANAAASIPDSLQSPLPAPEGKHTGNGLG